MFIVKWYYAIVAILLAVIIYKYIEYKGYLYYYYYYHIYVLKMFLYMIYIILKAFLSTIKSNVNACFNHIRPELIVFIYKIAVKILFKMHIINNTKW